ncbi:hypothetical protein V6N13_103472 [Hibiscus sabdariffa]
MNWRSLFAANKDHSVQFFPPHIENGDVTIRPPTEVFETGICIWKNSLVAQFLGKSPNFNLLKRLVNLLWGKFGDVEVNFAGENLFLFQSPNSESSDWVLANGPWHIHNMPIILRKWEPNLRSLEFNMDRLSVWIHLYRIPLELFTTVGLSYIASVIGIPLYMDSITAGLQRLAFAKV